MKYYYWNSFLMYSSFLGKISVRDRAVLSVCLASDVHVPTTLLKYSKYNGFLRLIPESIPMKTLH